MAIGTPGCLGKAPIRAPIVFRTWQQDPRPGARFAASLLAGGYARWFSTECLLAGGRARAVSTAGVLAVCCAHAISGRGLVGEGCAHEIPAATVLAACRAYEVLIVYVRADGRWLLVSSPALASASAYGRASSRDTELTSRRETRLTPGPARRSWAFSRSCWSPARSTAGRSQLRP